MEIKKYEYFDTDITTQAPSDERLEEYWEHNQILKTEKDYWYSALSNTQEEINCFDLSDREFYEKSIFLQDLMKRKLHIRNTISNIDLNLSLIFNVIDFSSYPITEDFSNPDNLIQNLIEFYQTLIELNKEEEAYVSDAASYCNSELSELIIEIRVRSNKMIQATYDHEKESVSIISYTNFALVICHFCSEPNIFDSNMKKINCSECRTPISLDNVTKQ